MYFSKIFKIKEGKLEKLKNWFDSLNTTRKEEAIATFKYEGVTRETFVLFRSNNGNNYIVGFNEALSVPKQSDQSVTINQEHRTVMKECLEPISDAGEILMDLSF
jgi:hypothetical protein